MAILIEPPQPPQNELSALQNLSDNAGFLKKLGDGNYSIDNNNYLPLSGGTVTNELSVQHISQSGATWTSTFSAFGIDLGQSTSADEFSFIDFHSGGALVDFDARIQCTGGYGNGENRGGSLKFLVNNLSFITGDAYNPKIMTIDANGNVSVDGTLSGNGSGLTSLNASNISTGTLNAARLPTSYLPLSGGTVTGVTTFSNKIAVGNNFSISSISGYSNISLGNNSNSEYGQSSIEIPTNTLYGGVHHHHTGVRLVCGEMVNWGTAKFKIYASNYWATYNPIACFSVGDAGGVFAGSSKATSFIVGNNQVVSSRRTGWTAPTGTASRSTFSTSTVTLVQLAERVKALIDDLIAHGLIGA